MKAQAIQVGDVQLSAEGVEVYRVLAVYHARNTRTVHVRVRYADGHCQLHQWRRWQDVAQLVRPGCE